MNDIIVSITLFILAIQTFLSQFYIAALVANGVYSTFSLVLSNYKYLFNGLSLILLFVSIIYFFRNNTRP